MVEGYAFARPLPICIIKIITNVVLRKYQINKLGSHYSWEWIGLNDDLDLIGYGYPFALDKLGSDSVGLKKEG